MDESRHPPTATVERGNVRVDLHTSADLAKAWAALYRRDRVAAWFGDLDKPWQPDGDARIDFGDGDFFDVTTRTVSDRELIEFEWRFLGVGPLSVVRWTVAPDIDGTVITVADHDPERGAAGDDELATGWTDFFERLAGYLATGKPTRYAWRDDIDGSVDLPEHVPDPLDPDAVVRWLPIASDGFRPSWFFVVDPDGPRRFPLRDWQIGPNQATFTVELPGARALTSGTVGVERGTGGRRLWFRHAGWLTTGLPDRQALALRTRFTATWVAALERARTANGAADDHER